MKILILSPALPNRYHRVRLYHLIQALKKSHVVTVACLSVADSRNRQDMSVDYTIRKSFLKSLLDCLIHSLSTHPFEINYYRSNSMQKLVKKLANSHDIIMVKRLRAVQYLPNTLRKKIIIDTTDAMSLHYKQLYEQVSGLKKIFYWIEWKKYMQYESKIAQLYPHWIVSSDIDKNYLVKKYPQLTITVVPNVTDINFYTSKSVKKTTNILFFGLMDKQPNIQGALYFLTNIFPRIQRKIPDVMFTIVGPNPPRQIRKFRDGNHITITDNVPNIRTYIDKAQIVVVPLLSGTGTKNKILQSWAHGRPVVSTTQGHSGLKGINGRHILIGDTPAQFAKQAILLLTNIPYAQKMGREGRKLVVKYYSISTMSKRYNRLLDSL